MSGSWNALETVEIDVPAAAATSLIVTARLRCAPPTAHILANLFGKCQLGGGSTSPSSAAHSIVRRNVSRTGV